MVEVPSAAYMIGTLARMVDFIAIGSNDLTQYILAVDRSNVRVAQLYDSLHPAVLFTLNHVCRQAHAATCPVSVCGEMAGDPAGALALMGMGIDSFSMSLGNLLKIKWVIRSFSYEEARGLLRQALQMDSAQQVRAQMNRALDERGLGGLVRAGH